MDHCNVIEATHLFCFFVGPPLDAIHAPKPATFPGGVESMGPLASFYKRTRHFTPLLLLYSTWYTCCSIHRGIKRGFILRDVIFKVEGGGLHRPRGSGM